MRCQLTHYLCPVIAMGKNGSGVVEARKAAIGGNDAAFRIRRKPIDKTRSAKCQEETEKAPWEWDREAVGALEGAEAEDSVGRDIQTLAPIGKTTNGSIVLRTRLTTVKQAEDAVFETCFEQPAYPVG